MGDRPARAPGEVGVKGIGEIKVVSNRLPELRKKAPELAKRIVSKTAFDIEAHAKTIVPVDTGLLRMSIFTRFHHDGFVAEVGPSTHYAIYVEYGTKHMAARPYLRPAVDKVRPGFESAIKTVLG